MQVTEGEHAGERIARICSSATPAAAAFLNRLPGVFCMTPLVRRVLPCRDHVDELVENCKQRNATAADPRLVARLYDEFTLLDREADGLRKERNDNAASMKVRVADNMHKLPHQWSRHWRSIRTVRRTVLETRATTVSGCQHCH